MQRAARVHCAGLQAVEPRRGHAPGGQHLGQCGLVEHARVRNADQDLIGFAERQEALADQALVACEKGQLHANTVALLHQLAQRQRLDAPAAPDVVGGMHRRVVADHARAERGQQLRQRTRCRHHADQADRGAAEFAPDQQPFGIDHRHAAQHGQQRADHEFGLGHGAGGDAADHLDAGAAAGIEVDVLGARTQAPDGAQDRREVQHLRVERHRGRNDQRADVEQRLAQCARVAGQLGGISNGMAFAQPLHDLGFERLNDQDVHAPFGPPSCRTQHRCMPELARLPRLQCK